MQYLKVKCITDLMRSALCLLVDLESKVCDLCDTPVPAVGTDGSNVLLGVLLDPPSPYFCLTPLQFQALFSKTVLLQQIWISEEQIAISVNTFYLKLAEYSPKFCTSLYIPVSIIIKSWLLAEEQEGYWLLYKVEKIKLWPMSLRLTPFFTFGS